MKTLGMIGGISWMSTIEYYRDINEAVNRQLGGSEFPNLPMYSLNFAEARGFAESGNWDGMLERMTGIATHLRDAGADGLLLCANTAHVIADGLSQRVGLPVVNIVDATADAIIAQGLDSVALLGTRFTMEMDFFKDRLVARGLTPMVPDPADRAFINATIFDELTKGVMLPATRDRYIDIINALSSRGARGAIMGCTEIPLLIKAGDVDLPLFDTTAIHVDAAVKFILDAEHR